LENEPGFYDLLVRKGVWKNILRLIPPEVYEPPTDKAKGSLFVLPGNGETAMIAQKLDNALMLLARLRELQTVIDIVVFDTSPTPSLLHGIIYMATDYILYPTMCESYSLKALLNTIANLELFSQQRQTVTGIGISTIGIAPTMYRGSTVEHSENLKVLRERFGELVWEPLPMRITWSEAANTRRPVFSYAPDSSAAREAWSLVQGVLAHV
jgi:cellulose biosynthesis protein BcsQ